MEVRLHAKGALTEGPTAPLLPPEATAAAWRPLHHASQIPAHLASTSGAHVICLVG